MFKKLTLAKILYWTFRQLLLPSSAKDKNTNVLKKIILEAWHSVRETNAINEHITDFQTFTIA